MSEENIGNITTSDSNFALPFVNHHLLPDINFNGHNLMNNNPAGARRPGDISLRSPKGYSQNLQRTFRGHSGEKQ